MLLKMDYAKFGVYHLFCTKMLSKKFLGGGGGLALGKRRVKKRKSKRNCAIFTEKDDRILMQKKMTGY